MLFTRVYWWLQIGNSRFERADCSARACTGCDSQLASCRVPLPIATGAGSVKWPREGCPPTVRGNALPLPSDVNSVNSSRVNHRPVLPRMFAFAPTSTGPNTNFPPVFLSSKTFFFLTQVDIQLSSVATIFPQQHRQLSRHLAPERLFFSGLLRDFYRYDTHALPPLPSPGIADFCQWVASDFY